MMSADPRPASTVVLLRQASTGPEVFLLRRHGQSGFMAGATVFPGGKVDAADMQAPSLGHAAATCAQLLDLTDAQQARAYFLAAIRELHEESHVLLARDPAGRTPSAAEIALVDEELESLRTGHRLSSQDYWRVLAQAGLVPDLSLLVPMAWWITPRAEPRRFDTRFFAAALPQGQEAALDRHEATHALWSTPAAALHDHQAGGPTLLPPPTQHTLERLDALGPDLDRVLEALASEGVGPCYEPHFLPDSPEGPVIVMPCDPLHPQGEAWRQSQGQALPAIDRFVLQDGRFSRRRQPT